MPRILMFATLLSVAAATSAAAQDPINTALPVFSLDRATADLSARVVAMQYRFTSRQIDYVTFIVRYRACDFETSDPGLVTDTVSCDTSVSTSAPDRNYVFDMDRKTFDVEVSYTPLPYTALRFSHTRTSVGQTLRHTGSTDAVTKPR